MTTLQRTIDIFEDTSEIASIKQDFLLLYASTEKVRRGCFAKNDATKKELSSLIEKLSIRLDRIEKNLNLAPLYVEEINELPLFQFSNEKKND